MQVSFAVITIALVLVSVYGFDNQTSFYKARANVARALGPLRIKRQATVAQLREFIQGVMPKPLLTGTPVPIDVIFVLDASVNILNLPCELQAVDAFTILLNAVNPLGPTGTLVGIVKFNDIGVTVLPLKKGNSLSAVSAAINSDPGVVSGLAYPERGINYAKRVFLRTGRPGAGRLLFLYSDGAYAKFNPSITSQYINGADGIEIFAIPSTAAYDSSVLDATVTAGAVDHIILAQTFC